MVEVQTEEVLVVPTQLFHRLGHFQGFSAEVEKYLDELFSPEHVSYRPRQEVEEDPSFKQLIPYCILRYAKDDSLFAYTRGRGQGEGRLHAKRSIGIGGHICSQDAQPDGDLHPYDEGMRRELEEEVILETTFQQRCVGLINDDETEVGRVHLGVVHLLDVQRPQVRPREADIVAAEFQPVQKLQEEQDQFETWSQICLQALFAAAG
ncbi:MAG: phosphoesterase [Planctomycetales bacterium]|nr:phosphoesterase [Planctomycetales bacterium]NIM08083.1 phosphoesterase [Planctomycetales bacterium]NIN07574.1 phosphoesterase [Planctomycetales bacterium]NIN76685.1 phosphoesterase [Planctomycetales bacterium]NIO33873.1 phosphoesterase [Planctomycetales bacterium]